MPHTNRPLAALLVVVTCLWVWPTTASAVTPTQRDVRYSDKYERSVLDFWQAKSKTPTPVVIYFHGGGFRAGDKTHFHRSRMLREYLGKGVSFATVNYPFLKQIDNDYFAILRHTEEAIKFLQGKAKSWNIDPKRLAVSGSSAGALISGHLGHGTKLGISAVFAIQQPIGTDAMVLPKIKRGGPMTILYTRSNTKDRVHHPDFAKRVYDACQQAGIYSEVWGTAASGLPTLKGRVRIEDHVMGRLLKLWKLKDSEK